MSELLNLGPLTETWTPPQSCSHKIARSAYLLQGGPYAAGFTCSSSIGQYCTGNLSEFWIPLLHSAPSGYDCVYAVSFDSALNSDCWPNARSSYRLLSGYYSPGLVCPSGHTTACLSTSGGSYNFQFDFALASGGTAAGCCLSNYICAIIDDIQTCVYTATHTDGYVSFCSNTISSIRAYTIPTSTQVAWEVSYTTMYIVQQVLYAPMYRLNWHSSDLPASTTTTNGGTHTTPVTPQETATAISSETSEGISTGARAGIGAGVGAGVLAVIGFLGWFVLARRRAKKLQGGSAPPQTSPEHSGFEKAEMPGQQSWAHELPGSTAEPGRLGEQARGLGEATGKVDAVTGPSSAEDQICELGQ
ncbi:hypothetical protein F5Y14DRAFT_415537 [Nemania sp. NC0429]|nr:hypothetical protein F5Y14DRAFT_415537 [Nemania sp. NC0429]